MKPARVRQKTCANCAVISDILFRIQTDSSQTWLLFCPACRKLHQDNPFYRYGGTWKANKRH